jgi:periplasmic protein TonB
MEAKKNPSQDVHRQSLKFFLIGLAISVSLAITAFEWTTEKIQYTTGNVEPPLESYIEVMASSFEPPKSSPLVEKKIQSLPQTFIPTSLPETASNETPDIDFTPVVELPNAGTISFDLPKEDTTQIISLAEFQPVPVGGYESFYSQLSKNLNYPQKAIRQGVAGKVYVEFVVDRNGKISNMKILKGIGAGCDEEAMRVLTLTSWEPGKQRGKPVNVRMVMPVVFKVH